MRYSVHRQPTRSPLGSAITTPPGGKSNKDHAIPIEPALEAVLDRYLQSRSERHGDDFLEDPSAPLFVHNDAGRLTRRRIQYLAERIYKRAGLRAAVPDGAVVHALRHTFASQAIEYSPDIVGATRHPRSRLAAHHQPLPRRQRPEAPTSSQAHPAQPALRQIG